MGSGKNRKIRKQLEQIYGKGCFFERAHIAERIEQLGGIKTFKTFERERRYKGKPISYQITLHHLKHKSEGGPTTVENGANISEIAHQYTHSLPRDEEEIINNMLREFKLNCATIARGPGYGCAGHRYCNANRGRGFFSYSRIWYN